MRIIFIVMLTISGAGIISCSKTHEVMQTDEILVSNDLIGKWQVTQFSDSGIDKTAMLSYLNLQFNSTGEFLIFNNDSTIDGDWTIVPDIGLDLLRITVSLPTQPYAQFQGSWYAYDKTTSSIKLSNSSPSRSQVMS